MPYIYRVENYEGNGCYYEHADLHFIDKHARYNGHPRPEQDRGIGRDMHMGVEICGFLNLKQAQGWFSPNELLQLDKEGFILSRVKVKEITAIGETQVLAIR